MPRRARKRSKNNILSILHNLIHNEHESQLQHYKIRRRYGVLRRVDVYTLSRDCLFLIRKDIGGGWQRVHRRKYRVCGFVADGWDGDGEGSVGGSIQHHPVFRLYFFLQFCDFIFENIICGQYHTHFFTNTVLRSFSFIYQVWFFSFNNN